MNKLLVIFPLLFLTGCLTTGFEPKTTVTVVTETNYPELPDIAPLLPLNLIPFEADVPRDTTKVEVKNISKCLERKEEERNAAFWIECGENPILEETNIYLGMDQLNWNIMVENFAKLKERLFQYRKRLEEINEQRAKWRQRAEEERQKNDEPNNE